MDRSNGITLLKATRTQDADGIWRETLTGRDVFARVESVTRAEFFDGGRNGLNPEFVVKMFLYDYEGEALLRFEDKTYAIYRTYHGKNDTIELYVQREGGTNGKQ